MTRPKDNLLDWLRRLRKPKPQMMEISMSDYNKLMSLINAVASAYKDAQVEVKRLTVEASVKDGVIKSLRDELDADEIKKAEGIAILEGVLDAGGSTGGVVG